MLISNNFSYKITALQISDGDLTLCVFLPENLNYLVSLVPVNLYLECTYMSGVFQPSALQIVNYYYTFIS